MPHLLNTAWASWVLIYYMYLESHSIVKKQHPPSPIPAVCTYLIIRPRLELLSASAFQSLTQKVKRNNFCVWLIFNLRATHRDMLHSCIPAPLILHFRSTLYCVLDPLHNTAMFVPIFTQRLLTG